MKQPQSQSTTTPQSAAPVRYSIFTFVRSRGCNYDAHTSILGLLFRDCSAQIVKALNMVMLKVLESADRTTVFHVLIKFLR
jgi:hypothetical protein